MDLKEELKKVDARIAVGEDNVKKMQGQLAELKATRRTLIKLNEKAESLKTLQEIIK